MGGALCPRGQGARVRPRGALAACLCGALAAAAAWAGAAAFAEAAPPRRRRGSAAAVRQWAVSALGPPARCGPEGGACGWGAAGLRRAAAQRRGRRCLAAAGVRRRAGRVFGWGSAAGPGVAALEDAIRSADVVFFDDPACPYCRKAEVALRAEGIDFTLLPIAEHREALEAKTRKTSAPSVWVKGTYIGGCNDGTEPWHGVRPCIESGLIKELLEDPAVRSARTKVLRSMLAELQQRADKEEAEKQSLAKEVEQLEASAAAVEKDTKAAAQEALDMQAKIELAESETESFKAALVSVSETVSAAVYGPESDPIQLLKVAVTDIAASEEKAAQLLRKKQEASRRAEALGKKLEEVARARGRLEAARERAKRLSAGIDAIATGVGVGGGNLFSIFSDQTDEGKINSILEKVKAVQT